MLATEATALVHGRAAAEEAPSTARRTFEEGDDRRDAALDQVARGDLEQRDRRARGLRREGRAGGSNSEARRQIKAGGLRVNDTVVSEERMVLTARDLTPEGVIKLSLGRKRHVLLKAV